MCMNIPDAPDIDRVLRTGYPRPLPPQSIHCEYCGKELFGEDSVFSYEGDLVCDCCFLNQIQEDLLAEDIARKLGFRVLTASRAAEEQEEKE